MISIIIPTLNESKIILDTVSNLQNLRKKKVCEIIVVDGKSTDNTCSLIRDLVDKLIIVNPNRSYQLNAGANVSKGEVLLFLHADTFISEENVMRLKDNKNKFNWGFFSLELSQNTFKYKILETCINLRSYIFNYATGDQGIFIKKEVFEQIKGFPNLELMEDLAICKSLKKISNPLIIKSNIMTSARKWEKDGFYLTVFKMRLFRILYALGLSTRILRRYY